MKAFTHLKHLNLNHQTKSDYISCSAVTVSVTVNACVLFWHLLHGTPSPCVCMSVCVCDWVRNQRTQQHMQTALFPHPSSRCAIPSGPRRSAHRPTSSTSRAVHPSAILRSVTLASHDILSHRQPHSSSVSSCEGAWDPATGGGHFKGRPAHSCSLSLQQPAPVCNHY